MPRGTTSKFDSFENFAIRSAFPPPFRLGARSHSFKCGIPGNRCGFSNLPGMPGIPYGLDGQKPHTVHTVAGPEKKMGYSIRSSIRSKVSYGPYGGPYGHPPKRMRHLSCKLLMVEDPCQGLRVAGDCKMNLKCPTFQEIPPANEGEWRGPTQAEYNEQQRRRKAFKSLPLSDSPYLRANGSLDEQELKGFHSAGILIWRKGANGIEILMAWEDRWKRWGDTGPIGQPSRALVLLGGMRNDATERPRDVAVREAMEESGHLFGAATQAQLRAMDGHVAWIPARFTVFDSVTAVASFHSSCICSFQTRLFPT